MMCFFNLGVAVIVSETGSCLHIGGLCNRGKEPRQVKSKSNIYIQCTSFVHCCIFSRGEFVFFPIYPGLYGHTLIHFLEGWLIILSVPSLPCS